PDRAVRHAQTVAGFSLSHGKADSPRFRASHGKDQPGPSQSGGGANLLGWPRSGDNLLDAQVGSFAWALPLCSGSRLGAPVSLAFERAQSSHSLHPLHLFATGAAASPPGRHARANKRLVSPNHAHLAAAAL